MNSDKEIASIEDADKISRYVSVWVNTFPEKPVPIIRFEHMELEKVSEAQMSAQMSLETVQGTRITKRYILGGYQAEYSFRLVYRIHPDNSNDMRLDAEELLNRFGDWASKNLPDLGEGVTARRVEQTTQSAKHVAYTDGDEDYQIMMKLTYEVL